MSRPAARRPLVLPVLALLAAALTACGNETEPTPDAPQSSAGPAPTFSPADCGGVTDADIADVVGSSMFTQAVVSDAGCFWQEGNAAGAFEVGMGISTWWYRGSDLDTERTLERKVGRELVELTMNGNKGFKAFDDNACSVYVSKGNDVITWSVQTVDPARLPDLCSVVERLAQLSQDRVS